MKAALVGCPVPDGLHQLTLPRGWWKHSDWRIDLAVSYLIRSLRTILTNSPLELTVILGFRLTVCSTAH